MQNNQLSSIDMTENQSKFTFDIPTPTSSSSIASTPVNGESNNSNNSKKRTFSQYIGEKNQYPNLIPIHIMDFNDKSGPNKEIFYNQHEFLRYVSTNSGYRIKHTFNKTYSDKKCKDLVTKRYMYFRIDQKANELEKQFAKQQERAEHYKEKFNKEYDEHSITQKENKQLKREVEILKQQIELLQSTLTTQLSTQQSYQIQPNLQTLLQSFQQPFQQPVYQYQLDQLSSIFNISNKQ